MQLGCQMWESHIRHCLNSPSHAYISQTIMLVIQGQKLTYFHLNTNYFSLNILEAERPPEKLLTKHTGGLKKTVVF